VGVELRERFVNVLRRSVLVSFGRGDGVNGVNERPRLFSKPRVSWIQMRRNRKLLAVTLASLLLFSAFVPGAVAATVANSDSANTSTSGNTGTTANAELSVSVTTGNAGDVTANSATLDGELTELSGAEEASVSFRLYEQGNHSNDDLLKVGEQSEGTFSADVSGLSPDTTYVFVAKAEAEAGNAEVEDSGAEVAFTTANAETGPQPLGVETAEATEVTGDSATLNGDLTGVGNAENVYVQFVYYASSGNAGVGDEQTVDVGSVSEAGGFSADLTGLENNTTYVYYARATTSNAAVTGEEVSFTAGETEDEGFVPPDGPFGQQVVAFVDYLQNSDDSEERNLGQAISSWVTANNPGADNRPDHAGPPSDRGPNADEERGPPEDKGPNADEERGPPDHAGPDGDDADAETEDEEEEGDSDDDDEEEEEDDSDDDEEEDEEEDDKGGPPEGKGYNK
jgi:hypothetical protein